MSYYLFIKENMEQKKYQLTINTTPVKSKPPKNDNSIGIIYNKLNLVTGLTVNEIATIVQQPFGYTWSGGIFNGPVLNDTWKSQSVIGLDFDNRNSIIYPENVVKRLETYSITPQIWYHTFSSNDKLIKFRIILLLNDEIKEKGHIDTVLKGLKFVFPEADPKCFKRGGFFFAGTNSEIITTEEINTKKLTEHLAIELISKDNGRTRSIAPLKGCSFFVGRENGEKSYLLYNNNNKQQNSPNSAGAIPEGNEQRNIDWNIARQKVKIVDDFLNGQWLDHDQLFGLATNLININGGRKLMKETMIKYNEQGLTEYTDNNFNIFPYLSIVYYPPQPIHTFSDKDEDKHIYDLETEILNQRGKIQVLEAINKIPLEEAEQKLKEHFEDILRSTEFDKIHILKLPTAIGKTRLLTSVANATISFPTNKLKQEVTERMSVPYEMTPNAISFTDDGINKLIEYYYAMGLQQKAVAVLHNIVSGNYSFTVSIEDLCKAKAYLNQLELCMKSRETILTTHTRAIHTKFVHDTIIFDEDPIGSLVKINHIKISDLFVMGLTLQKERQKLSAIIKILECTEKSEIKETPIFDFDHDELIQKVTELRLSDTNIFEFFTSSFFVKDSLDTNIIHYVNKINLPKDKKIIILSATINPTIYKYLLGISVQIFDVGDVEQKGNVTQYTKRSCSRKGLAKYVKLISEEVGNKKVVTFKSFTHQFSNASDEIYFGNCSGYNTLAGEDLVVVGTPHRNNIEYLLLAKVLGIDFNSNDTKMRFQEIEYNGFRFMFNCYDHHELRELQLGLIESDLIQAIGRARTLRTDAKVEVYSNFPLRISDQFIWKYP
jgi:hypothetical protein